MSEWYSKHTKKDLADRIEELEAKLKTAEEIGRAFEEDAGQLRAKLAKAVEALSDLHHAVCGETGFAHCVRVASGKAYPWPALDMADWQACATLAELSSTMKGQDDE